MLAVIFSDTSKQKYETDSIYARDASDTSAACLYLEDMYARACKASSGVGSALHRHVVEQAQRLGLDLELHARRGAVSFYMNHGWQLKPTRGGAHPLMTRDRHFDSKPMSGRRKSV